MRTIEAMLDELKPIRDAMKIVDSSQVQTVHSTNFGWNKLRSVERYLNDQAIAIEAEIDAYFADSEVVNV